MTDKFVLSKWLVNKNKDNRMVKFYNQNVKLSSNAYMKEDEFRVGSINVHGFHGINATHTVERCIAGVFELIDNNSIDVLGIQEYNNSYNLIFELFLKKYGLYSTRLTGFKYSNIIVSRYQLYHETAISLPGNDKRTLVTVELIDNKNREWIIGVTHLSILPRNYECPDTDQYRESVRATFDLHMEQLDLINEIRPDILLGDFNFNTDEPEYDWMRKRNWCDNSKDIPTTPFGTIVDFIWTKFDKPVYVLGSIYTDHRPVIADIPYNERI